MVENQPVPTKGPTRGASEPSASWQASPALAIGIRALVILIPLVGAFLVLTFVADLLYRPPELAGLLIWLLQAVVTGTVCSFLLDRLSTRLLPLATLCNMSLVFPDQAPSRFGTALRTGSVRKLEKRIEEARTQGLGATEAEAAAKALELISLLSHHDRLTRGHTERVRAYADTIAVELGLSDDDRARLAWGVLLHDIGKITVPSEVLNKVTKLNDDEWELLRGHPAASGELLAPLSDWLGEWMGAATEHHERWDGNGYPNKLTGNQISLAGRITAVADAYDVITSHRSYKTPLSIGAARKELVDCAGTHFDPAVVRALLQASLRRQKPRVRIFGWLPELPGLATVSQGIAAAPAAAATVAIAATAPLTGIAPPEPPSDLAFSSPPMSITADEPVAPSPDENNPGTDSTAGVAGGQPASGSEPTGANEATTSLIPNRTGGGRLTTEPGPSAPGADPTSSTTSSISAASSTITQTTTTTTPATTTIVATTAPTTTTTTALTTATTAPTTAGSTGPTAEDDAGTQREGKQKQYAVLDNDIAGDAPLDPSTLAIVTPPAHGTAVPWASNKIRYQAADGYIGTVTIVYEICDTSARCSQATLTLTLIA